MRLAIAYSTRNEIDNTRETLGAFRRSLRNLSADLLWADASTDQQAADFYIRETAREGIERYRVFGGADAAIAWKLTSALKSQQDYTHIGLLENDVLLDPDWLEPTLELFAKGKADGLSVGVVSPRSYVDRVLIQRDGYAVMHNVGAGAIIFTRESAEIVLRSFRTHWWPDNVKTFAQVSGIDLRTYAAFRGNDQFVTTDWGWEAQLARHGLAALALTPAKCQMIGQKIPLEQQGLELTIDNFPATSLDDRAFAYYRDYLACLRSGKYRIDAPGVIHRDGPGMLFFPHQLGYLAGGPQWAGTLELKWSQGFGPFAYRAGPGGASLSVRISGTCSFLLTGGDDGAGVTIEDTRSGFKFSPDLPAQMEQFASISVPGSPVPRQITMQMKEGAVFYGIACSDAQMLDDTFMFDWQQLPEAK